MSNKPPSEYGSPLEVIGKAIFLIVAIGISIGRLAMFAYPETWEALPQWLKIMWNIAAWIPLLLIFSGGNLDCFVATAVYGNKEHPDVVTLRKFRDQVLLNSIQGKLLIALYYRVGPLLAWLVVLNPTVAKHIRNRLSKLAKVIRRNIGE